MKKKYLSTSILTGLILASTNLGYTNVVNAQTYSGEGSAADGITATVDASTLVGNTKLTDNISNQVNPNPEGLKISNGSSLLFTGDISANNNEGFGVDIKDSAVIFQGKVTAEENSLGIGSQNKDFIVTFEKDVVANKNQDGIVVNNAIFEGSIITNENMLAGMRLLGNSLLNGNVTANNNSTGIVLEERKNVLGGNITTNNNRHNGINIHEASEATFNDVVTANENVERGIFIRQNSLVTFNKNVSVRDNEKDGIVINKSRVTFNGDLTASENKSVDIDIDEANVIFEKNVTANRFWIEKALGTVGSVAQITFGEASILNAPIRTFDNSAMLRFKDGASINKSVGRKLYHPDKIDFIGSNSLSPTGSLIFSDKTTKIDADIYGENLMLDNTNIKIMKDLTMSGDVKIASTKRGEILIEVGSVTKMELGQNTVTIDGKWESVKDSKLYIDTEIGQAVSDDKGHMGHLIVDKDGNVDDLSNITLTATKGTGYTTMKKKGERAYNLFVDKDGNGIDKDVTLSAGNLDKLQKSVWTRWAYDKSKAQLKEEMPDEPINLLAKEYGSFSVALENAKLIENTNPELFEDITTAIDNGEDPEKVSNFTNSNEIATSTAPTMDVIDAASQRVDNRLGGFREIAHGVSSGEDAVLLHGAWFSPIVGSANQKGRSNHSGYKAHYYGGVIGVDTLFNDSTTIGAAITAVKTDIKHKGINDGDKTESNSYMLSLYANHEFTDRWFIQGMAFVGQNKTKHKEVRVGGAGKSIASAKYTSKHWGTEIVAGHNYNIKDLMLFTPKAGLEFTHIDGVSYTESGTQHQNMSVKRKAMNKINAVASARLSNSYNLSNCWMLIPNIHAGVKYGLNSKDVKIDIKDSNSTGLITSGSRKVSRALFNVGFGAYIKDTLNPMIEYGAEYDLRLADKYVGHQGALKLRVNF